MSTTYLQAVLTEGIQNPNYFNGKVLTARDLRDEQTANRLRARRLGQAIGEGVAAGLFVTQTGADLHVSAGVAVNRQGDVLVLPRGQTLSLSPTSQIAAATDTPFRPCVVLPTVTPINAGLYLLALTLASELSSEQAPHSGLNGGDAACISRYETQGVQFKLVGIETDVFPVGTLDAAGARLMQSRLAAACFGFDAVAGLASVVASASTPFAMPGVYGLVDALRVRGALQGCDVPLAVLRYSGGSITFVDTWAVRRPVHLPYAHWALDDQAETPSLLLPQHSLPRRALEAQAFSMQFQTQLNRLLSSGPSTVRAQDYFKYLPPAGYLPGAQEPDTFFGSGDYSINDIDPAHVRSVLQDSWPIDPILLAPQTAVPVTLYRVLDTPTQAPLLLFVRARPIVVSAPEPTSVPAPTPGALIVRVTDDEGDTLLAGDIERVEVMDSAGKTFGPGATLADYTEIGLRYGDVAYRYAQYSAARSHKMPLSRAYEALTQSRTAALDPTWSEVQTTAEAPIIDTAPEDQLLLALYSFSLPAGQYVVAAYPEGDFLRPASRWVTVTSNATATVELALRTGFIFDPVEYNLEDPFKIFDPDDLLPLKNGYLIEQIYIDLGWADPYREEPPLEWQVEAPSDVLASLERGLSDWLPAHPGLVTYAPELFIDPTYTASGTPADEPYAFIRTQDGRFYPVILVGGEHALDGEVPVTRGGIADIDTAEFDTFLRDTALENLDALSGAWTGLVADRLRLDTAGARSLVTEARSAAAGLQESFARYPGISGEADTNLKAQFSDDVALANATAEDVQRALGEGYSLGFATRLVERARANVAPSAWSLDSLDLGTAGLETLRDMGIETLGGFNAMVNTNREQVRTALELSEAAFDDLVTEVRAGLIAGTVGAKADAGVASVKGITSDQAEKLFTMHIHTSADLAEADQDAIASALGISADEAATLIRNAAENTGELAAFQTTFGLDQAAITAFTENNVFTLKEIAASPAILSTILGTRASVGAGAASEALARTIGFRAGRFGA